MTTAHWIRSMLMLLIVSTVAVAQLPPGGEEASQEAMNLAKQQAEAYLKAFNSGDAGALADLYAEDANRVVVGESRISGRDEIQNFYRGFFADNRGAKLQLSVESAKLLRPDVLLVDGPWTITPRAGEELSGGSTVIFVEQEGQWLLTYLLVYRQ